jgi:hypothetical protein
MRKVRVIEVKVHTHTRQINSRHIKQQKEVKTGVKATRNKID